MASLEHWRLCSELSVIQAALLILEEDPAKLQDEIDRNETKSRPIGYEPIKLALTSAIANFDLDARTDAWADEIQSVRDWGQTFILVDDLKSWLLKKNSRPSFFFPSFEKDPEYLSPGSRCYSPKLAAAVQAWKAVSADPHAGKRRSVKSALVMWLKAHAAEFGLSKDDGSANEQGIQEIAKIAN